VYPQAFLAQGNRVIVWFPANNHFSEWDLEANRETQSWPAPAAFVFPYGAFGLSPTERLGIGIGREGDVSGWEFPGHRGTNLPLAVLEVTGIAFSPDEAVSAAVWEARIWRTATWREEATLRGFLNGVTSVIFHRMASVSPPAARTQTMR
jgi:hypothetical protein